MLIFVDSTLHLNDLKINKNLNQYKQLSRLPCRTQNFLLNSIKSIAKTFYFFLKILSLKKRHYLCVSPIVGVVTISMKPFRYFSQKMRYSLQILF